VFPIRREQLTIEPAQQNQFFVLDNQNVQDLSESAKRERLGFLEERLHSELDCCSIVDNEVFDVLYSFTSHMDDLPLTIKSQLYSVVTIALNHFMNSLKTKVFKNQSECSPYQLDLHRNSAKMYVFLASWLLIEKFRDEGKENVLQGGKKKKGANNKKSEQTEDEESRKDIYDCCVGMMETLNALLQKNISVLWKGNPIEEQFMQTLLTLGFDLMEKTAGNKDEVIKAGTFTLIQSCLENHQVANMVGHVNQRIVNLLFKQEGIAPPLAELVSKASQQCPSLINETI